MIEMAKALVLVETNNDKVKKSSLEVINCLSSQGVDTDAVVFAKNANAWTDELGAQGAKRVFCISSDTFNYYQADNYAPALTELFEKESYDMMSAAASALSKDLFPTLAVKCDGGYVSDCIEVTIDGTNVKAKRPMLAGKYFAWATFNSNAKAFFTIRPNVLPLNTSGGSAARVESFDSTPPARAITTGVEGGSGDKVDLTEAEIIVSGGRSLKSADNFKILNELADVLGATVGASRAAVDAGYAPHSMQVGQTGKTVNPVLYIACGISGAIQHLAGMKTSKVVVAINTDPEAPIFQKADYGAVGDLFEVVPALTTEFKKLLAE